VYGSKLWFLENLFGSSSLWLLNEDTASLSSSVVAAVMTAAVVSPMPRMVGWMRGIGSLSRGWTIGTVGGWGRAMALNVYIYIIIILL